MKYTENYNEIKQAKSLGLRGYLRNIAMNGLFIIESIQGIDD